MANGLNRRGNFDSPTNVAIAVSSWKSLVAICPTSTNTVVDVVGASTHGLVKHLVRLIKTWVPSLQRKNKNPS
ncbi:hypothetical protein O181_091394 [Austropuccinia psidii MF-1]|uniref:Uncharacterized protein n=1 Tax=Austropuccinia psidii MF-1 TaxID=1389203 RepID=A0A9Q3IXH8_9BASI|nr:hypothetical protein [Austropuccinia psidii MF-1]